MKAGLPAAIMRGAKARTPCTIALMLIASVLSQRRGHFPDEAQRLDAGVVHQQPHVAPGLVRDRREAVDRGSDR